MLLADAEQGFALRQHRGGTVVEAHQIVAGERLVLVELTAQFVVQVDCGGARRQRFFGKLLEVANLVTQGAALIFGRQRAQLLGAVPGAEDGGFGLLLGDGGCFSQRRAKGEKEAGERQGAGDG